MHILTFAILKLKMLELYESDHILSDRLRKKKVSITSPNGTLLPVRVEMNLNQNLCLTVEKQAWSFLIISGKFQLQLQEFP